MDKTPNKPKKNIHAGHRKRMRHRFIINGLNGFADHEVLELLLFYAMPRRDVNPMAHALMDKFGSLPAVLDAPVTELCEVYGVGPKIAHFLNLIPDILLQVEYYCRHPRVRSPILSPKGFTDFIRHRYIPPTLGNVFVIPMDLHYFSLAVYTYTSFDTVEAREIVQNTLHMDGRQVMLAECVEDPSVLPTDARIGTLVQIQRALANMDIRLVDFYRFDPTCDKPQSAASIGLLLP